MTQSSPVACFQAMSLEFESGLGFLIGCTLVLGCNILVLPWHYTKVQCNILVKLSQKLTQSTCVVDFLILTLPVFHSTTCFSYLSLRLSTGTELNHFGCTLEVHVEKNRLDHSLIQTVLYM